MPRDGLGNREITIDPRHEVCQTLMRLNSFKQHLLILYGERQNHRQAIDQSLQGDA